MQLCMKHDKHAKNWAVSIRGENMSEPWQTYEDTIASAEGFMETR